MRRFVLLMDAVPAAIANAVARSRGGAGESRAARLGQRAHRRLAPLVVGATTLLLVAFTQTSAAAPREMSGARQPPRVTVIGDSVATAMLYDKGAQAILGRGVDLRIELSPCRRVAEESCTHNGMRAPSAVELVGMRGKAPRVTMITDSVAGVLYRAASQRAKLGEGLDFRLEVKSCRKLTSAGCYAYAEVPPSALETIERLGFDLGRLVIIDVGYNDFSSGYAEGLDRVMSGLQAAGVERVVWVTLHESQMQWARINEQIRVAPSRWPQLTVAEWAPVAAREPSWFVDGAHMNESGAEGYVAFLRPVLLAACGEACIPPEATATMLKPVFRPPGRATLRWRGNPFARTYDVALRRTGGAWRTMAARLAATTYRVRGVPGARVQARVRAYSDSGVPGAWSQPQSLRF